MDRQRDVMRLGYLSGAPRVSTHFDAEAAGARAHVLGLIRAFEDLHWTVKPFIVGNRVPQKWVMKGSERTLSSGFLPTLAADLVRLGMNVMNGQQAWRELGGHVDWVYERFACLQALGWTFKRQGVPWILETNGPFFYEAKTERKSLVLTGPARWVEIKAYQECDVLVCISEMLKEIIVREASLSPEKVVVVPNGVDTAFFDPKQYKPIYLFEDFTIGFVGGLLAWQGLDLLLEALHDLRAEGMNVSLVVMGDGPMQPIWKAQAQQLGIAANVVFVGRKPWQEVPQYIAGFDVGYSGQVQLQAEKMYHSPLKLYEYMAMAKPVVASAFEDAKRVIQDRETGFLFQAGDKEDLKRALVGAYQCRDVLPEIGRRAREEVVANHSWIDRVQTMIERVEQVLRERDK